ncbi:hypothetical protein [Rathayibacter rathayi]|uniref:hypothetical protein n=1 Tax=Rathayibacter rathayi TaxID=33887 RepID=UPI003B0249B7
MQVASDVNGNLLCVSDPTPGARHDRATISLCGWEPILENAEWIADPAYIGTTADTPRKNLSTDNMMTTRIQPTGTSPPSVRRSKDASRTGKS